MFGQIKGLRYNARAKDRPAPQNSSDALNIPRRRSLAAEGKDALMNAPLIAPGINELVNATVGTGRRLKPLFNAVRLGLNPDQTTQLKDDIKMLWREHTMSKRKWIDQEGDQTLAEMQRMVLTQTIAVGECYTLAYWFNEDVRPFRTALAIIDEDRVRDPQNLSEADKKEFIAGHRKGDSGRTRSYAIHPYHRNDPRNTKPEEHAEVRRYNEFGREQVIHTYIKKSPGLTRGLSDLSTAFSKLKCFEKYEKVRLESAIMQTAMALVVKSDDKNLLSQITGSGGVINDDMLKKVYALSLKKAVDSQQHLNGADFSMDGAKAIRLMGDETAELLTGSESGVNDKQFVDQCLSSIARSTGGLSRATLTQDFEASYSAARASLISFYRQAENLGCFIVDDWLRSVYTIWLEDVILSGQIQIPNYPSPIEAWAHFVANRELYCGAEFCGPARDEIDQAKQMTYWRERRNLGAFTYQGFYDSRGTDWQEEIRQQFEEMKFIDGLIAECDLEHLDPIAFIQGKLDAVVVDPANDAEQTDPPSQATN